MGRGRFVIALLLAGCSTEERPLVHVEISATCAGLLGRGEVRRAAHPYWEPLGRGTPLADGDWVRTNEASTAHLELLAGGRLDLAQRSVVVIERSLPSGPRIALEEGELRATLVSSLTVRRPNGASALLEAPAVYRVVAGADAGVEVTRLDAPSSETRDAGVARAGRPPSAFPSSVSPGIDARLKFDPRGWVKLTWSPVPGASRYRVQTARDWSFAQEARNADVEGQSWLMRPDALGLYVWRVAALSEDGQPGEYGYARRLFLEAETPTDLLVSPTDGFTSQQPGITFSWEGTSHDASYRVMVSKGPDPQRQPVFNEVTRIENATANALLPGTYHWGVYEEGAVLRPLFLKPRKLVVLRKK